MLTDPEIDVIVELIGGEGLAKRCVEQAIANGKHVVTANKALIAKHGNELFQQAEQQGVSIAYEASVAGGISIIKALREGLAANDIELIAGIINGTGNFILTEMLEKGRSFDDVLVEAQQLGYAEADPSFDVNGIDAAHKLCILASIGFGIPLQFERIHVEGIEGLALNDLSYAMELGYRIKHLGVAKLNDGGIELRVHPTLVPEKHLLANVNGVMNAVLVRGDAVGSTLQYGAGAGAEPTASAVVADLVDVVRMKQVSGKQLVPHLGFVSEKLSQRPLLEADNFACAYYLRLEVSDQPGVMAEVAQTFAKRDISIEAVIQREPPADQSTAQIILLTEQCAESEVNAALEHIQTMGAVVSPVTRIRVEHLD